MNKLPKKIPVSLGDQRLNKRYEKIVCTFESNPELFKQSPNLDTLKPYT